jgi:hypothetical protein
MADLKFLKRIGYSDINTLEDDDSAFFYESGLMIDADGAYHAYHPDNKSGLDYLGNAGQPGNWWALVTDNGQASGRPLVQTDADPAPGFYISTTSLEDPNCDRKNPRRYVNAEALNFIILPGRLGLGAKLGDFATVIRPATGVYDYAVYADIGLQTRSEKDRSRLQQLWEFLRVRRPAGLAMGSSISFSRLALRTGRSRSRRSISTEPSFLRTGEDLIRQKTVSQT